MGNAILKKVLAFALSLTLMITMAPIIPGAAAKASAAELLPAPIITIDANGVATCTDVEGAAKYSWLVSRAGSILDPGDSYDVYNTLVDLGEDSGQYEVRVYAEDADNNTISEPGTATYDFTSPHTHVWDYDTWEYDGDYGDEYHWHPCTAENCSTPNYLKEGASKHEYFNGACVTCGKERVLLPAPTITIDENGVATWSAVEGVSVYSWGISTFGGNISPGEKIDIPTKLTQYSKGPGYYTLTIYAKDSNGQVISETATANYDARTIADTFVASSSFKAPVYGERVTDVYDFTFTSEVNAGVPDSMGNWYKKVDGEWERYEYTVFTDGTYRYSNQLRVEDDNGKIYRLPKDKALDITINGEKWTSDEYVSVWPTYSYVYMYSPEYVVEKTALDLAFEDNANFDIKNVYQNRAVEAKSVRNAVIGGEEPYVFSKTSGPSWINVSSDGTVSGTPDVIGENEDLVVRVTDNKGDYKEITIDVANTLMNPNDRAVADTFVASSSFKAPALGESVTDVYDFSFTSEVNADVPDSMGNWYKKVGDEWVEYTASTFGVGDYYYSNQLRLDSYSGTGSTHRLPDNGSAINVTINGEKWTVDPDVWVDDAYSYVYMDSPVYEVRKELPNNITLEQTSYTYDGTAKEPNVTVGDLVKDVDYIVSYENNIKAGTAKVIITGIGDYFGFITETFTILNSGVWKKSGTKWWYRYSDGTYPKSCWETIDGKDYHFDAKGYMEVSKWVGDYYVGKSGAKAKNQWVVSYYVGEDGKYIKNQWAGNYYCGANGKYQKGWLKLSEGWYYLGTNGKVNKGWFQVKKVWYYGDKSTGLLYEAEWLDGKYYFKSGGAMATGWLEIEGDWYYFKSGGAVVKGWLQTAGQKTTKKSDDKWYYFDEDGKMVTGEYTIKGVVNKFADSGLWLGTK